MEESDQPVKPATSTQSLVHSFIITGNKVIIETKPATSTQSLVRRALAFLTENRDGFLVAGALVYALGFLTWSINSLRIGIGFIDVLDAQYIVAGIIPSALIFGTIYYIAQAHKDSESGTDFRGYAVSFCFIVATVHVCYAIMDVMPDLKSRVTGVFHSLVALLSPSPTISGLIEIGFLVLWRMSLYLFYLILSANLLHWLSSRPEGIPEGMESSRISHYFSLVVAWGVVIMFLVLSMWAYIDVFPSMPQEIGGGQGRCAWLDVQLDKLSEESARDLRDLIGQGDAPVMNETNKETMRTRRIYIVYFSDKTVFFSLFKPVQNTIIYEVSREAVSLISWCVGPDRAEQHTRIFFSAYLDLAPDWRPT
jgi:hypothetical protein